MDMTMWNYGAIAGCVVSNMVLGFLWYGPLFGKMWMGYMGITPAKVEEMKKTFNPAKTYGLMAFGALVTACVLSLFITNFRVQEIRYGLELALWCWLGFVVPVGMGSVLWEGKAWGLYVLNMAYQLVALALMAIILTVMNPGKAAEVDLGTGMDRPFSQGQDPFQNLRFRP